MTLFFISTLGLIILALYLFYAKKKSQEITQLQTQNLNNQMLLKIGKEQQDQLQLELTTLQEKHNQNVLHDPVTHLLSRQVFEDRLSQVLAQSKRYQLIFSVVSLDIDGFKFINNALGYAVGDELLKQVSIRLKNALRQIDSISRFGGDEFVILLPQLNKAESAAYVAQRLLDSLLEPFVIQDQQLFVTATMGIAVFPNDGDETSTLLRNADNAMHQAKMRGRNVYQFYREEMQTLSRRELMLSSALRSTAVFHDFSLYYQPIVDVSQKKIVSMEALLRWQHPDFGFIPPKEFLRFAENSGNIVAIGEWVLRNVCTQIQKWKNIDFYPEAISVNVSLRQLENPHFTYKLSQVLQEMNLAPQKLLLEVAEGMLVNKLEMLEKALNMLKHLGVQIAIDDYGTGNLGLQYLRRFPIDYLKIDGSLIKDIANNSQSAAICKMIITLAESLQLKVIAENVETLEQKQVLLDLGCYLMQGHLFSIPRPAEEFTQLVEKNIAENT